ncbi:MAG: pyridoxal-phosphate dependent enzyme [Planctomycetota bacterium]
MPLLFRHDVATLPGGELHPAEPARLQLADTPTPLERCGRLLETRGLDPDATPLLVKRDDRTGLATSGNKIRKLEYLVCDALRQSADTLVTMGGVQSNHCRATAAVAARLGLRSRLILRGRDPRDAEPSEAWQGNLVLDELFGAEVSFHSPAEYIGDRAAMLERVLGEVRDAGRKPYFFPTGGSVEIGSWGYVRCVFELAEQLEAAEVHGPVDAVGVSSNQAQLDALAHAFEREMTGDVHRVLRGSMFREAQRGKTKFRAKLEATFKLGGRRVAGAFGIYTSGDTLDDLKLGVFTRWKPAPLYEKGGTITPRKRYLAVPVAPWLLTPTGRVKRKYRDPRTGTFAASLLAELRPVPTKRGLLLVGEVSGHSRARRGYRPVARGSNAADPRKAAEEPVLLLIKATRRNAVLDFFGFWGTRGLDHRRLLDDAHAAARRSLDRRGLTPVDGTSD